MPLGGAGEGRLGAVSEDSKFDWERDVDNILGLAGTQVVLNN